MDPADSLAVTDCSPDRSDDADLWEEARLKYLKESPARGDTDFHLEQPLLRDALRAVREATRQRYHTERVLGVGATGIVFRVCDNRLRLRRALKIARPVEGKSALVESLLKEEIGTLQEVSHPNVMGIFDTGDVAVEAFVEGHASKIRLPFFVMSYIKDGVDAREFFEVPRTQEQLISFVTTAVRGIAHLHAHGVLHLDIKPANIFVAAEGTAVVADLGAARRQRGDLSDELLVTCTRQYAHPDLLRHTTTPTNVNRVRGRMRRDQLRVTFDLFALGKSIFELMTLMDRQDPKSLNAYCRKYLSLLAARLLDGHNTHAECALGLGLPAYKEIHYTSISETAYDLGKLTGEVRIESAVEELSPFTRSSIQASTLAATAYTPALAQLLKEPLIRRLASITQLGLLNLIYPTASHTRLDHALGTYTTTAQYIFALYYDPLNPLFRQIIGPTDVKATLLAALLHDLGQYPLAHDLEEACKPVFGHEALTATVLKGERVDLRDLSMALSQRLQDDWGVTCDRVLSILSSKPSQFERPLKDRLLHCIISGPLDADKVDYLVRDGRQCQVPYARVIDFTRLVRNLTVTYESEKPDKQYIALGVHEKGRVAAECVAFARYSMFAQVYWHHASRASKAMLHRAVWEWLEKDQRTNDQLKTELHQFVLNLGAAQGVQGTLFPARQAAPNPDLGEQVHPEWSQIHTADRAMLAWLYERSSDAGRRLIGELSTRLLYKRLAVIADSRNPKLWKDLQRVAASGWKNILALARDLRQRLHRRAQEKLRDAKDRGRRTFLTGEEPTRIDAALEELLLAATILVDIPLPRNSDAEDLRYYPEDQHRHQREEFSALPRLGESEVWRLLGEGMHKLAGKVRVFCTSPILVLSRTTIEDVDEPVLGQLTLESELQDAASAVLGEL